MAENTKPTRTLSDIRPPSSSAPTPPTAVPKKAEPKPAPAAAVEAPAYTSIPEPQAKPAKPKRGRKIWKILITGVIILVLIAAVAAVYFYVFTEA